MLNVRDECDLPEDDGYDLFTRETEVERRRRDKAHFGARRNRCPAFGGVVDFGFTSLRCSRFAQHQGPTSTAALPGGTQTSHRSPL